MCGILLVKSKDSIPLSKHLSAFRKLESRGPDFSRYQHINNIFIGQSVLHITGSSDYYNQKHTNFLAYNGEIYNYRDFGPYRNDIEFVNDCVENNIDRLNAGWGPWAFAWTDGATTLYASDPQGERCLYQYQDDSILIVASEIEAILEYIQPKFIQQNYASRHWAILDQTPYAGIKRIKAGELYHDGLASHTIDSIWSWVRPADYNNFNEAYEDFKHTWQYVTQCMTPACSAGLAYSGGLDSSIILSHIDNLELYATNMTGKDPIVDHIQDFLTDNELARLHQLDVNEQEWAKAFLAVMDKTCMPVQSWSFVGQWIINQQCRERVMFTGLGADELFGGYNIYQTLAYSTEQSASPYSQGCEPALWQQCLTAYHGDARQATLLADYLYQIAGCDARGVDTVGGAWGIESRSPFLARPVMQLALSLPFEYKVGLVPKPLIRKLFLERWAEQNILPKKGFSGHCNDSLPWLGVSIDATGNRDQDWQQILTKSFYNWPNQLVDQTIQV